MLVVSKKISFREFQQMEFDNQDPYFYELINGELLKKSAPKPKHQRAQRNLLFSIHQFVTSGQLGEILPAPVDVFLDEYNVPQPDLVFVSKKRAAIINADEGILGAPDLVIEIISPSSVRYDRIDKKELYEQFGIKEYWIVDPSYNSVEIYALQDNRYKLFSFGAENEKVKSSVLKNIELEVSSIFS